MADQTIRGVYELSGAQPRRELRSLRTEAEGTERAIKGVGRSLDHLSVQARSVRTVRKEFNALKRDVLAAEKTMTVAMHRKTMAVKAQQREVRQLRRELVALGRSRASASVDVKGIARAIAEIDALERKLDRLDRRRSFARAGVRTSSSGSSGGGSGGGLGGDSRTAANDTQFLNTRMEKLGALALAALPAVQALGAGLVSLASSAAMAATGAGALGVAGVGALGVGIASITLAAKPAFTSIQNVFKAQTALTQAQRTATGTIQQQRDLSWQLQSAHDALTTAQQNATMAQRQLTDARREATRAIQDQRMELDRSRLSQARSNLEVRRARADMQRVELDPMSTEYQRQDARLSYQDAVLSRREAVVQRQRAVVDTRRLVRRGVRGSDQVISARQGVRQSMLAIRDAQRQIVQLEYQQRGGSALGMARLAYQRALSYAPTGTGRLVTQLHTVRNLLGLRGPGRADPGIRAGQRSFVGLLNDQVRTGIRLMPMFGRISARSTAALRTQGRGFDRWLSSRPVKAFFTTAGKMFVENLGGARKIVQNVAQTLMNVTRAARPFLREAVSAVQRWTAGWRQSSGDIQKTQGTIGRMVGHLRSWVRMMRSGFRLVRDIGRQAAPSGKGLVGSFTRTLNTWDRWVNRNPAKVRAFFKQAAGDVRAIGRGFSGLVRTLHNVATLLRPLLGQVMTLLSAAGNLGLIGTPGVGAAAYGIFRGSQGGRNGSPGGSSGAVRDAQASAAVSGLPYVWGRGAAGTGYARAGASGVRLGAVPSGVLGTSGARRYYGLSRPAAYGVGLAEKGLRAAAPFLAINALIQAAGTSGGVSRRTQAAVSGLTFGAVPAPGDPNAGRQRAATFLQGIDPTASPAAQLRAIRRQLATRGGASYTAHRGWMGLDPSGASIMGGANINPRDPHLIATIRARAAIYGSDGTDTGKNIQKELLALIPAEQQAAKAARDYARARHATTVADAAARSRLHAVRDTSNFEQRFRNLSPTLGAVGAFQNTSRAALAQIGNMRRPGALVLAQNMLTWSREQARQNPVLWKAVDRLQHGILARFKETGKGIQVVNGQILTRSKAQWTNIWQSITDASQQGVSRTSAQFQQLQQLAIGSLRAMGYNQGQASRIFSMAQQGGTTGRVGQYLAGTKAPIPSSGVIHHPHGARGMRIPGQGTRDTVPLIRGMAAPGELIVNRHTEARVNRALSRFNTTLGHEVAGEHTPHSRAMYATGGRTGPNFFGHPSNVAPSIRSLIGYMERRWPGLSVTSTTDHSLRSSTGGISFHSSGHAVDMAGTVPYMNQVSNWIMRSGLYHRLSEGIHNPSLSVKYGKVVPSSYWAQAWGQHLNHIHMAIAGGAFNARGLHGGRGGGARGIHGRFNLPGLSTGLPGVPGALGDAAIGGYRGALIQRIRSLTSAGGGGHAGGAYHGALNHNFGKGSPVVLSPRQVRMLAARAGLPSWFWKIAKGESSFMPGAYSNDPNGYSHGRGLYQITPEVQGPGFERRMLSRYGSYYNPWSNTRMAADMFRHASSKTPNTPGFPWYGTKYLNRGGRAAWGGWHGKGGSGLIRQPTLIGVGDGQPTGGSERVTVERVRPGASASGGSKHHITISMHFGDVHVKDPKEFTEVVEKAAERVAERLSAALDAAER